MSWFGPKLARGERILFRHPDNRRERVQILGLLPMLAIWATYANIISTLGTNVDFLVIWLVLIVPSAIIHLWLLRAGVWRIVVTDRRLLARPEQGRGRGEIVELPRDSIEAIRRDAMNQRLFLRVNGEETAIPFDYEASDARLRRALEPHAPVEMPLWAPLRGFLEPGEKIVMRYPPSPPAMGSVSAGADPVRPRMSGLCSVADPL